MCVNIKGHSLTQSVILVLIPEQNVLIQPQPQVYLLGSKMWCLTQPNIQAHDCLMCHCFSEVTTSTSESLLVPSTLDPYIVLHWACLFSDIVIEVISHSSTVTFFSSTVDSILIINTARVACGVLWGQSLCSCFSVLLQPIAFTAAVHWLRYMFLAVQVNDRGKRHEKYESK